MIRLLALLVVVFVASPCFAHKPSDAYLTLQRDGTLLTGQWDIALRDLELAIGLDADGDGDIRWGEVKARHEAIAAYALARLRISSGGSPCAVRASGHQIDDHTDGAYAVVHLDGECPAAARTVEVAYTALFDIDPQHRGLLHYVEAGRSRSIVLSVDAPRQTLGDGRGALQQFAAYVREGIGHIATGFDHVLFVVSLLLPSVLVRRQGAWQPAADFGAAFRDVFRIVTAFTIAHSMTLTLAVLGLVTLPSRLVESTIAASVALAALNNLVPLVDRGRWLVAFVFGLVHGFGFAGALQDLGLPRDSLALSLAAFNIGVELGQLAIVAVMLPAAFAMRGTLAYRRVLAAGSLAIVAVATIWLVERALGVALIARLAQAAAR